MIRMMGGLFWEQWRRSRTTIMFSVGVILFFALFFRFIFRHQPPTGVNAALCWIPPGYAILPLLMSLLNGETGANRKGNGFPRHAFLLPVRSSILIICPMLFGMLSIALWYLAVALLVFRPVGINAPLGWPMVLLAAGIVWLQALGWSLGNFLVGRILAFTAVIMVLGGFGVLASGVVGDPGFGASAAMKAGIFFLFVGAFFVALEGVNRARSGFHPFGIVNPLSLLGKGRSKKVRPFISSGRAQLWFEWKEFGKYFPAYVGFYLGILLLAALSGGLEPGQMILFDLMLLFLCPFLAPFLGLNYGRASFWKWDFRLTLFSATRPMSCESLAAGKLRMGLLSVGAAWMLVLAFVPPWMLMTGQMETASALLLQLGEEFGRHSVIAAVLGIGVALFGITWILLSLALSLALCGRKWLTSALSVPIMLLLAFSLFFGISRSGNSGIRREFLRYFCRMEWILVALVSLGVITVFSLALKRGHISAKSLRTMLSVLSCGALISAFLIREITLGMGGWRHMAPAAIFLLLLGTVPLAAAPLALEWNRHR